MKQEDIIRELEIARNINDEDIDYSNSPDLGDCDWHNFRLLKLSEINDFIDELR